MGSTGTAPGQLPGTSLGMGLGWALGPWVGLAEWGPWVCRAGLWGAGAQPCCSLAGVALVLVCIPGPLLMYSWRILSWEQLHKEITSFSYLFQEIIREP